MHHLELLIFLEGNRCLQDLLLNVWHADRGVKRLGLPASWKITDTVKTG